MLGRLSALLLLVDDDAGMRKALSMRLEQWGFHVVSANDIGEARQLVHCRPLDLAIASFATPELSGLNLLQFLKNGSPDRRVILISDENKVSPTADVVTEGVDFVLAKPFDDCDLQSCLKKIGFESLSPAEATKGAVVPPLESEANWIIGVSPVIRKVKDLVRQVAGADVPVLVTGESGTGKDLIARTVHRLSRRAENEFLAINCAAIPESLFESELFGHEKGSFTGAHALHFGSFELADQGTLFLDEVNEMPLGLQAKLLRVLETGCLRRIGGQEEKQIDVRMVAAMGAEPRKAIEARRLREDLYYRLSVFTLSLPPLRQRTEDIPLLVAHFIAHYNQKHGKAIRGVTKETMKLFMRYPWPGNVRELRNVIERAVILTQTGDIKPWHVPFHASNETGPTSDSTHLIRPGITVAEAEKRLILATLQQNGNNKAKAARQLGLDVKTIRNKLHNYKHPHDCSGG
ncbi:MAG: sigma-54 dependent transcriptional regulator [Acidobacteriota bacterium]